MKNKRGSISLIVLLSVVVMMTGWIMLSMANTALVNSTRHRKQLENVYTYESVSDLVASTIIRQLDSYNATAPRTLMQDISVYETIASEIQGHFISGDGAYTLFSTSELLGVAMPNDRESAAFVADIRDNPKLQIKVKITNLFVMDTTANNLLNFGTGDYFYCKPITLVVNVSDGATTIDKAYELKNVKFDVTMTNTLTTLAPSMENASVQTKYLTIN